jgi:hypothetical protein
VGVIPPQQLEFDFEEIRLENEKLYKKYTMIVKYNETYNRRQYYDDFDQGCI